MSALQLHTLFIELPPSPPSNIFLFFFSFFLFFKKKTTFENMSRSGKFWGASKKAMRKNTRLSGLGGGATRTQLLRAQARRQAQLLGGVSRFMDSSPATSGFRGSSGSELKGVDTQLTGTIPASTNTNALITIVNGVQAGSGSWNRIGRRITMKSLRIKGALQTIYIPDAVTGAFAVPVIRMVVVYDRQVSSGTLPNFDVIFGRTDQAGTEGSTVFDSLKYDNMERFAILLDRQYSQEPGIISANGSTQSMTHHWSVDEYIKLKGLETTFASTANPITSADISTGGLYVIFRSNADAATNRSAADNMTARLRFMD